MLAGFLLKELAIRIRSKRNSNLSPKESAKKIEINKKILTKLKRKN
jgi:hypothetical protein